MRTVIPPRTSSPPPNPNPIRRPARRTTTSVSLHTLTTIAQTSLHEQCRQIPLEERTFARITLHHLERDIQLTRLSAEALIASGNYLVEDMNTHAGKQAERDATLRVIEGILGRQNENARANIDVGQQSQQVAAQTNAQAASQQAGGKLSSAQQLVFERELMQGQQAAYEAQLLAESQKEPVRGQENRGRDVDPGQNQAEEDPLRVEEVQRREAHLRQQIVLLRSMKERVEENERLERERERLAASATAQQQQTGLQQQLQQPQQARAYWDAVAADLARPRTAEEKFSEQCALVNRHNKFADRIGHTGAWNTELIVDHLFYELPNLCTTFVSATIRCRAQIGAQATDFASARREAARKLVQFWDRCDEKLRVWLVSTDAVPGRREPVKVDLGGKFYQQEQHKSHLLAQEKTEPIMRELMKTGDKLAVHRFVGRFDMFYGELNSNLHWGALHPYGMLLKFFAVAMKDLFVREGGEEYKWEFDIKASDLEMTLYQRPVTSNSMRLWVILTNAAGNRIEIPLCSFEPESHIYPIIVGEFLTMAAHSPHGAMAKDADLSPPLIQSFRAYISPTTGSIEVAAYSAPLHHLRYMADLISGRLPGQCFAHAADAERKAYFESDGAPTATKTRAPQKTTDFTTI